MKKVLILSLYFAPDNCIGAIRPAKIAKYLKLNAGYDITVITIDYDIVGHGTIDPILQNDLKYVDDHVVLKVTPLAKVKIGFLEMLRKYKHSKRVVKITSSSGKEVVKRGIYQRIFNYLERYFSYLYGYVVHKSLSKIVTKYITRTSKYYDVVYSAFGLDYYIDTIACKFKQQNPNVLWISNYDDPWIRDVFPKKGISIYESHFNNVAKTADIITGISDICIKQFLGKDVEKLYVFYNGFDKDELSNIGTSQLDVSSRCNKFTLTYTGHLYLGRYDLCPTFRAISELIEEKKVDKDKILINYAGKHENEFIMQASQFCLIEVSKNHGFVDRQRAMQLQMESTMLLLASWNKSGFTDVITGKFYEYLMMDKPIVCTITGNLPNSKLKEIITEANVGIVWEEAAGEEDYPVLKAYLLEQYERFIRGDKLQFKPNREYIRQYDYKYITQQYIDLIEEHFANTDRQGSAYE